MLYRAVICSSYGGEIGAVISIGNMLLRRMISEWYKKVRSGVRRYCMVLGGIECDYKENECC